MCTICLVCVSSKERWPILAFRHRLFSNITNVSSCTVFVPTGNIAEMLPKRENTLPLRNWNSVAIPSFSESKPCFTRARVSCCLNFRSTLLERETAPITRKLKTAKLQNVVMIMKHTYFSKNSSPQDHIATGSWFDIGLGIKAYICAIFAQHCQIDPWALHGAPQFRKYSKNNNDTLSTRGTRLQYDCVQRGVPSPHRKVTYSSRTFHRNVPSRVTVLGHI